MFQLRVYTLRSVEALEQYATVHWTRHVPSLEAFRGLNPRHLDTGDAYQLIALIQYNHGADPTKLTADYMSSSAFEAGMAGFDLHDIVAVNTMLLDATARSPMQSADFR
jgi:hypothetical protein